MPFNPASLKNLAQNRRRPTEKNRALPMATESVLPIKIQQVASQILADSAPDAAQLLQRLTRGGIRAPVQVRLQAALKILESQGLLGQPRELPNGRPTRETLMQALELRRRSSEAVDATLVDGKA